MSLLEEKIRNFQADLDEIDLRNTDYFLFERFKLTGGERDCLKNHCYFEVVSNKALFGFHVESPLPYAIRKQCFLRFEHYFPDGNIVGGVFGKQE